MQYWLLLVAAAIAAIAVSHEIDGAQGVGQSLFDSVLIDEKRLKVDISKSTKLLVCKINDVRDLELIGLRGSVSNSGIATGNTYPHQPSPNVRELCWVFLFPNPHIHHSTPNYLTHLTIPVNSTANCYQVSDLFLHCWTAKKSRTLCSAGNFQLFEHLGTN